MINAEVTRQNSENAMNTIRRFTKLVQSSGVLKRARSIRYFKRTQSKYVRKSRALSNLAKQATYAELLKLGKAPEARKRR